MVETAYVSPLQRLIPGRVVTDTPAADARRMQFERAGRGGGHAFG